MNVWVYPDTGQADVKIRVDWLWNHLARDCPLEQVITCMREAAEGLEDPYVSLEGEYGHDDQVFSHLMIHGHRKATAEELQTHAKDGELRKRWQEHVEKFDGWRNLPTFMIRSSDLRPDRV